MGLLSRIINIPPIGKTILKFLKKKAFRQYQISIEEILERQEEILADKFRIMERTEIGKKLGVHRGLRIKQVPLTDYTFYEPFYTNPSPSFFMYSIEDYIRARTSGTAGKEKWFMMPKPSISKMLRETGLEIIFALFHDGEKITLEYGDTLYVNTAPRPFPGGFLVPEVKKSVGLVKVVPNLNLSYKDKVQHFILNHDRIQGAKMLASTMVSQIMPALKKPIKLKGFLVTDSIVAETYKNEIESFIGTAVKTVYGSAETLSPSVPSIQQPLGFILDWRRGIFEFLPLDKNQREQRGVIGIEEVKVGDSYRLIYTSLDSELTRYNIGDLLKCVAKGDDVINTDLPVFKFQSRLEKTISINGFTRISEEELLTVLKESKIPYVDFTARIEIEEGLEYLAIYLELFEEMETKEIQELIHRQLYKMDKDYRDLSDFFDFTPVKIRLVKSGVFVTYSNEVATTSHKVDRVKMSEENFKHLLKIMERH